MGASKIRQELAQAIQAQRNEVRLHYEMVGRDAVAYAKAHGQYNDVTGNLRRSNHHKATADQLILENTADYATDVESRGKDVLTGAINRLRGTIWA